MALLQDPFYLAKDEVEQGVNGLRSLHARWQVLLKSPNTAENVEFEWATNQLREGVSNIELDLQELEDTIRIVENNRQRFKLDQVELDARKKIINETQQVIRKIKEDLDNVQTKRKMESDQRITLGVTPKINRSALPDQFAAVDNAIEKDHQGFISKQLQEEIFQDEEMGKLEGAVLTLNHMAHATKDEIVQHGKILDDLDAGVDRTHGRLNSVMRRVNKLLESRKDRMQWCVLVFLVLIFIGLIVTVFYV